MPPTSASVTRPSLQLTVKTRRLLSVIPTPVLLNADFRTSRIHSMGFATTAIHAGQEPDSATGAVSVPIYQTSTYAQEGLGKHKGFEYARTSNPTRLAVERNIAALEGAKYGFAFASGMAAIDATLRLIKKDEHVIVSDNTYGGTFRLFHRVLSNYGIEFDFVDTSEVNNVEAAIKDNTRMVFVETPTNPVMIVT